MIIAMIFGVFALGADAASEVRFSRANLNLYALETYRLTLTKSIPNVKFTSSDERIVTISDDGLVTAISSGSAEVYAVVGTDIKSKCNVKVVSGNAPKDISISEQNLVMTVGDTKKVKAEVSPDDATDKSVYVFSSDESVAKIDKEGKITAIKPGAAVITFETSSSAVSKKCMVKVISKTAESNTKVAVNGVLYSIAGEKKRNMVVELKGPAESVKAVTDSEGKFYFEDIVSGNYDMYVYNDENSSRAVCSTDVTIFAYDMNISCIINGSELVMLCQEEKVSTGNISDITLDASSLMLNSGESYDMTYKVRPANVGTPTLRGVSSDVNVVTVDADGRITAVAGGKANVTFSTLDGKISKTCVVTVSETNSNKYSLLIISSEVIIMGIAVLWFCRRYKKFMRKKEIEESRQR